MVKREVAEGTEALEENLTHCHIVPHDLIWDRTPLLR
jgi:hypothetical protein